MTRRLLHVVTTVAHSNVAADGRLATGQNPQSAKATAERVGSLP